MPTTKNVKIQSTFEVSEIDGTICLKKVTNLNCQTTQGTQTFPQTLPGNVTNVQMPFGGVTLAKRVFIRTNYPVTLKFNQSTDTGFSFGPGDGWMVSDNGITNLFVSTGPNPTDVEVVVVG